MSFQDGVFVPLDTARLGIDKPILATDWQKIAANQNHLFRLALGEQLPGGANPASAHDHADGGGTKLPLGISFDAGYPARAVYNGTFESLEFTRSRQSVIDGSFLSLSSRNLSLAHEATSGDYYLYFADDLASTLNAYSSLSAQVNDSRLRLLVKKAIYNVASGETCAVLWDPAPCDLASGQSFRAHRQEGSSRLPIYLPSWANTLSVYLHAASVITSETASTRSYLSPGTSGELAWIFRLRLCSNDSRSEAICTYAAKEPALAWYRLSLPLGSLPRNATHDFHISIERNAVLDELSPVLLDARDYSLVLQAPAAAAQPLFCRLTA